MDYKFKEIYDPIVAETGETLHGVLVDFDEYKEMSLKALLMDFIIPVSQDTIYLSRRVEAAILILRIAEERGYFRKQEE